MGAEATSCPRCSEATALPADPAPPKAISSWGERFLTASLGFTAVHVPFLLGVWVGGAVFGCRSLFALDRSYGPAGGMAAVIMAVGVYVITRGIALLIVSAVGVALAVIVGSVCRSEVLTWIVYTLVPAGAGVIFSVVAQRVLT